MEMRGDINFEKDLELAKNHCRIVVSLCKTVQLFNM